MAANGIAYVLQLLSNIRLVMNLSHFSFGCQGVLKGYFSGMS